MIPNYVDLHIHSHFSRATSPSSNPATLAFWAKRKGLDLIGTGDLTHPGWLEELNSSLVQGDDGFYGLPDDQGPRFIPTGEISAIYRQDGRTRKIHLVIVAPDLPAARRLSRSLGEKYNVTSDGRPILPLSARDIVETVLEADNRMLVIPAHIWTPWFSLFGHKSGFDRLEDCFGDLSSHITALETGLSSDPTMNRLISALDSYNLVSFSDAHSPDKLGREATILSAPLDRNNLWAALKGRTSLLGTVEFFPEEGKYYQDGHIRCGPAPASPDGICPACGRPLTIGVLSRVKALADRDTPENLSPFWHILPLPEILAQILGAGPTSRRVSLQYDRLLSVIGSEYYILMSAEQDQLAEQGGAILAQAISNMRSGQVIKTGGYDGQFGRILTLNNEELRQLTGQGPLFEKPTTKPRKNPSVSSQKGGPSSPI